MIMSLAAGGVQFRSSTSARALQHPIRNPATLDRCAISWRGIRTWKLPGGQNTGSCLDLDARSRLRGERKNFLADSTAERFSGHRLQLLFSEIVVRSDDSGARKATAAKSDGCFFANAAKFWRNDWSLSRSTRETIAVLGRKFDANLGQKDLAISEAQHAIDLVADIERYLRLALWCWEGLAQVYTWDRRTRDPPAIEDVAKNFRPCPGYTPNYGPFEASSVVGSAPRRSRVSRKSSLSTRARKGQTK